MTSLDQASAAATGSEAREDAVVPTTGPRRQRWWLELPLAVAFYAAYAQIRDWHGSATLHDRALAQRHGFDILHAEKWLHLDIEQGTQTLFFHVRPVLVGFNVYYGTLHFLATIGVFIWLMFRGAPAVYRRMRNVLAIGTAIGLVCFALYPTMPPRLMPPGVKTIDTMDAVGSLWSYNHGVLEHISDPFAAMPSLHIVWASWVAYVFYTLLKSSAHRQWRFAVWAYPVFTGLVVIATGTHWVLDLVGGALVFVVAVKVSYLVGRRRRVPSSPSSSGRA